MSGGPAAAGCPACGAPLAPWPGAGEPAPGFDPFFQVAPGGRVFRHRECAACGLLATAPTPTDAELAEVYGGRYDFAWFQRRRALKRLQARHRWWRLRRWRGRPAAPGAAAPRLLDIGAGQGDFVRCARRAGWDALGLDPAAPGEADDAVRRGGVEALGALSGPFHLITFWHCLEHLPAPRAALADAARLLAPGGRLVLALPNRRARGLARAGRGWGWLQEPYVHLWHFTPEALAGLLPAGLALRHVETREAWDQQSWFATRRYGLLVNRLPPASVRRREALHLAGICLSEISRFLGGASAARRLDRPELVIVAERIGNGA